jgi:DNA-directed RNA polymerase specialized sigma24 family protein
VRVEEAIEASQPTLRKMAGRYAKWWLPAEDLLSEAHLSIWRYLGTEADVGIERVLRRGRFGMIDALRHHRPRTQLVPFDPERDTRTVDGFEESVACMDLLARIPQRRHARLLYARYYEGRGTTELMAEFGVCNARISQLSKKGLAAIREELA